MKYDKEKMFKIFFGKSNLLKGIIIITDQPIYYPFFVCDKKESKKMIALF